MYNVVWFALSNESCQNQFILNMNDKCQISVSAAVPVAVPQAAAAGDEEFADFQEAAPATVPPAGIFA